MNSPESVNSPEPKDKLKSGNDRGAFRINTRILLEFREVSDLEQSLAPLFKLTQACALQEHLDKANIGIQDGLSALARLEPMTAELLGNLNAKIDLVSRAIQDVNQQQNPAERIAELTVSLSSNGLSFLSNSALKLKQNLAIHIQLLPEKDPLLFYATVVRCKQADQNWKISLQITKIDAFVERKLSKYILDRQIRKKTNKTLS